MFNYVTVDFPETTIQPTVIYSAEVYQNMYAHEVASLKFKDWGVQYDVVRTGSPVHLKITGTLESRDFYGYVHHVNIKKTPGTNFTEVVVIGASYPMKQQRQKVYSNTTADQVVKAIADTHNFVAFTVPHPRVYPQVSQAGHSDWEIMVRLAKQSGYLLRANNTEIYFQPLMYDYTNLRESAPKFVMRQANDPLGSTLYSFTPTIGDSIQYDDSAKGAVAISGVDITNAAPISITQQIRNTKTRIKQQAEFFDKFDTGVVAPDVQTASYEAQAAESKNYFPYRGRAEVLGRPDLKPGMPVYLDGLGDTYSGYWVILEAHHHIAEEELNRQKYTTSLVLGTDSLGTAVTWTDSKIVTSPNYTPKRTVIPNVRQTNVKPVTNLNKKVVYPSATSYSSFGTLENRAKPSVNGRTNAPAIWQTGTSSLDPVTLEAVKPDFIIDRLSKKLGAV